MQKSNVTKKSLYTTLASGIFFPLHERLKKHDSVAIRKRLEETQWWDPQQLQAEQLKRLREFLIDIQQHVPYYRQLFSEISFEPTGIQSLADLEKIPLLTKPIIREQTEALKSDKAQSIAKFNTSGSSGDPLTFFLGKDRVSHDVAAKWRATRWWGVDIGDPEMVIWGSPIELGAQNFLRVLRDKLIRTRLLPTTVMSPQKLDQFLAEIKEMAPKMLFGYPSSIAYLAQHAESQGQDMKGLGIQVVFVTAERLHEHQSKLIRTVFGCPVANGYGGRDAGFIAHECPDGGMHITAEDIIVEIVDTDGNVLPAGQLGEIVVTHLYTQDFPFVRYRTGDMGILDDRLCTCGRGLPLLKSIEGRNNDFLTALDGTVMHEVDFTRVLRDQPQITTFKIIQESLDLLKILIVAKSTLDSALIKEIEQAFKTRLGASVVVDIEQVAQIPAEKSGKFRYVVSKVAQR